MNTSTYDIHARVADSIFKIYTTTGTGTGFYYAEKDILITNNHVIAGHHEVALEDQYQNRFLAQVVHVNPELDLAFLRSAEILNRPKIELAATGEIAAGDQVFVLGFPFDMPFTVTKGIISASCQLLEGKQYIQSDAAVNPGNSGGPMVNGLAQLVGVTTAKLEHADNVGFAIPADVLAAALNVVEEKSEEAFSVSCHGCGGRIYEATEYCSHCGSEVDQQLFEEVPLSLLAQFVEKNLERLDMNPVLARTGNEYWQFHYRSTSIRIFVFEETQLYLTAPLCMLPSQKIDQVYLHLLQSNVFPFKLGIYNNMIYLSYRIHITDIFSGEAKQIGHHLSRFASKAYQEEFFLKQEWNCPPTPYARKALPKDSLASR